jgi:hypothetical protein
MLAVVVADVEVEGDWQFERRQFGATPSHLRLLAEWLVEQEVEEVVMESTAQYWRPVGTRWNATGSGRGARGWTQAPRPARSISRRRSPIMGRTAGSEIFPMPSDWSSGWWRRS